MQYFPPEKKKNSGKTRKSPFPVCVPDRPKQEMLGCDPDPPKKLSIFRWEPQYITKFVANAM